jgi:acetyl esterase/lipase
MPTVKYRDMVFSSITVQQNISYSPGAHPGIKEKYFLFDLYEPTTDTTKERPLIIWLHGGGFKFGSKNAEGIRLWSETFAKRGFVCAGLNYQLSKKNPLFKFTELKRSCYAAVQDVEEAVAFFKKNHARFRIDTNRIILAGNSAGGMIALQAVYSSHKELAHIAQLPEEGLSSIHNPAHIAAVINLWGALFKIDWLQHAKVPIFSACGDKDGIVPPNHKDSSLYGSIAIHEKANALHIPNELKIFPGYSHELQKHFNPLFAPGAATKKRWLEAGQSAADFLFTKWGPAK